MSDLKKKFGWTMFVVAVALLTVAVVMLCGCDGSIQGRTIIAPYGLEIVELDTTGMQELCPDRATHIYHVRRQGDAGTLTWGGKHSLTRMHPPTAAQFEIMWPGLLAELAGEAVRR